MSAQRIFPARAVGLLMLSLLAACGGSGTPAEERARKAAENEGDVVVAVVWPWEARKEIRFGEGLDLAVEEINARGGINGRTLRLLREDDRGSVNEGRLVAQRLAENTDVVAVIGHLHSYVTVPAAAIYDLSGLVMLSPASTDAELTSKGYERVFRGIFTDRDTGRQMADYAASQGFRRIGIYYVRNDYGRALANAFEERASGAGLSIAARASYDDSQAPTERSFANTLEEWTQMELDAIFVAGQVPHAGHLVREIRRHGIQVPILGGDAMSSPALVQIGGEAAEGTVVISPFHATEPRPEVQRFTAAFAKRFSTDPDPGSALGYDAIRILAHAMERAGSADPEKVAPALRGLRDWGGVTGSFTFDSRGDLKERRLVKLVVRNGEFEYLPDPVLSDAGAPAVARP